MGHGHVCIWSFCFVSVTGLAIIGRALMGWPGPSWSGPNRPGPDGSVPTQIFTNLIPFGSFFTIEEGAELTLSTASRSLLQLRGCQWLCATTAFEDLVMNAVAMECLAPCHASSLLATHLSCCVLHYMDGWMDIYIYYHLYINV